jgi:hypothetical protein
MKDKKLFSISDEIMEKCTKFAENSVGTSAAAYARRNQFNVKKIEKDIRNGKIGEEIVYQYLQPTFPEISAPDHQVYAKKDKSWDPDLKDPSGLTVGVKSQNFDSAALYGHSWIFQFRMNTPYDIDKEVFSANTSNQKYMAFVSLNVPKKEAEIKALVRIAWLRENNLFKAPKKDNLKNNKVAVYQDDLNKFDNLFQL